MRLPDILQARLGKVGRSGLAGTRPARPARAAPHTVQKQQRPPRLVRPGPRGWAGPGGGADGWVEAPLEWRGTTRQVCGLWPHAAGSGVPNIGTVLGQHYFTATTVAADPINFLLHKVISNPGSFTLANAGVGKSFLTARLVVGAVFQGHVPFVMGDLKPDYVDLVARLGGQVATIGRGLGGLNVLNPGGLWQALHTAEHHLGDAEWTAAVADYLGWQQNGVAALLELSRGERLREHEETALAALLAVLRDRSDTVPVLPQLLTALGERPELVRTVLGTRDDAEYDRLTAGLVMSLRSITTGAFGDTFAHNRQDAIDLNAPAVCLDISRINRMDRRMEGAALLNAWYAGSAAIFGAHLLADAGLAPHRTYYAVMDELWRSLRAGVGMARRIDEVTRLGRTDGQAFAMVTHSPNDLELSDPEDRKIARGFLSRADMKLLGALQDEEIDAMAGLVTLSRAERDLLTSWSSPEDWGGDGTEQPGLGKFLLKVGSRPGVPFRVRRTATEATWRDTSHRWNAATRAPHPDPHRP